MAHRQNSLSLPLNRSYRRFTFTCKLLEISVEISKCTIIYFVFFPFKCKEWGFLLREVFGCSLGTGDYGHITIEHASLLFRNHLSLREYLNQGFEAAHSLTRQLYSKATSHERHGHASSS